MAEGLPKTSDSSEDSQYPRAPIYSSNVTLLSDRSGMPSGKSVMSCYTISHIIGTMAITLCYSRDNPQGYVHSNTHAYTL